MQQFPSFAETDSLRQKAAPARNLSGESAAEAAAGDADKYHKPSAAAGPGSFGFAGFFSSLSSLIEEVSQGGSVPNGSAAPAAAVAARPRPNGSSSAEHDSLGAPIRKEHLAYIHRVSAEDTIAGISVRYGCSMEFVLRSNGMWANDVPQIRSILVIPLSGCSVRTEKVPDQDLVMAQPSSKGKESISAADQGQSSGAAADHNAKPWTHDSWVRLPNGSVVEVASVPKGVRKIFKVSRPKGVERATSAEAGILDPIQETPSDLRSNSPSAPPPPPVQPRRISQTPSYQRPFLGMPGVGSLDVHKNACPGAPVTDPLTRFWEQHFPSVVPSVSSVSDLTGLPDRLSGSERDRALSSSSYTSSRSTRSLDKRTYLAYSHAGPNPVLAKGLDWVKRMASNVGGGAAESKKGPDNELALFSWFGNSMVEESGALAIGNHESRSLLAPVPAGRAPRSVSANPRLADDGPVKKRASPPPPLARAVSHARSDSGSGNAPFGQRSANIRAAEPKTQPWFSDLLEIVDPGSRSSRVKDK